MEVEKFAVYQLRGGPWSLQKDGEWKLGPCLGRKQWHRDSLRAGYCAFCCSPRQGRHQSTALQKLFLISFEKNIPINTWIISGCLEDAWPPPTEPGFPGATSFALAHLQLPRKKERPMKIWQSSLQPLAVSAHKLHQLSYGNYITWNLFNISIQKKELGSLAVTSNQRVLSWWAAPHHQESRRNLRWIGFKSWFAREMGPMPWQSKLLCTIKELEVEQEVQCSYWPSRWAWKWV